MALAFIDRLFRRKKEEPPRRVYVDDSPPRTYVISRDRLRFEVWCHNTGTPPYGKDIRYIPTNLKNHSGMRGVSLRLQDRLVVLEDADFGHYWHIVRRDVLLCSENKIDLDTQPQVRT